MRFIVLLIVLGACHKTDPNCERAVNRVIQLTSTAPPGSEPKPDEQRVIDQIGEVLIEKCSREGLSDAQRDCILAAPSMLDRDFLLCPALVEKHPSWLIAPIGHPELLDDLERRMNKPEDTK